MNGVGIGGAGATGLGTSAAGGAEGDAVPPGPGPRSLAGRVGIVLVGRNEGARLSRALDAVAGLGVPVVYADSGSGDDSVARARAAGARVVPLDNSVPHTAARGRNAGFDALRAAGLPDYVQFIDGDCALAPGWIEAAVDTLDGSPQMALVTGWRSEMAPEASVYNAMCEVEWHRPAGEITACGGDMMVRAAAFAAVGGFDATLIASEDEDLCRRLAKAGWRLHRLPLPMTRHDADMARFSQWWRRAVRAGHGFAEVGRRHPEHFRPERLRVLVYAVAVPLATVVVVAFAGWPGLAVLLAYPVSWWRAAAGLRARGLSTGMAAHQALLLTVAKFPQLLGMALYHGRRLRGRAATLIEYK